MNPNKLTIAPSPVPTARELLALSAADLAAMFDGPHGDLARAEVDRRAAKRAAKRAGLLPSATVDALRIAAPALVAATHAAVPLPSDAIDDAIPTSALSTSERAASDGVDDDERDPSGYWRVEGVTSLATSTYATRDDAARAMYDALQAGAPWSPACRVFPGRALVTPAVVPMAEPDRLPPGLFVGPDGRYTLARPVYMPEDTGIAPSPAPVRPERTRQDAGPAPVSFTWTTGEHAVSDVAVDRITGDAAHVHATFGIALPPPVVELGGRVNQTGVDNLHRSHQEWADDPRSIDALQAVRDAVRNEARQDVTLPRTALDMAPDGTVAGFATEVEGIKALVSLHPDTLPGMARGMLVMPADLRAQVWNTQRANASSLTTTIERDGQDVVVGTPTVLRTRAVGGRRSVYAVVSDGYTSVDADVVADVTREALARVPGGTEARGEAVYTPGTTALRVNALWHANHVQNFSAGDVFKGGIVVKSHDGGGGAIRVEAAFWRNLCYNLIIIGTGRANVARIVHTGDRDSMIDRLARGIEHVAAGMAPFLARWGHLRTRTVADLVVQPSADQGLNLRAVFRALAGASVDADLPLVDPRAIPAGVDIGGIRRDALVEALLDAHAHEPGESLADVVNAVTRLHADTRIPIPAVRAAEESAGRLVMAWSSATHAAVPLPA